MQDEEIESGLIEREISILMAQWLKKSDRKFTDGEQQVIYRNLAMAVFEQIANRH